MLQFYATFTEEDRIGLVFVTSRPDETIKKIGECVGRSTLREIGLVSFSPSEDEVKEWVQSAVVGGNSLIHSLEHSLVTWLVIGIMVSCLKNDLKTQLRSSLQKTMDSINLRLTLVIPIIQNRAT